MTPRAGCSGNAGSAEELESVATRDSVLVEIGEHAEGILAAGQCACVRIV